MKKITAKIEIEVEDKQSNRVVADMMACQNEGDLIDICLINKDNMKVTFSEIQIID